MINYSFSQALRTDDGEEIGVGPYNSNQAPFMECANCKTPITVGQAYCLTYRFVLGVGMQSGRLVPLATQEWPRPVWYHEDCSAEFAHAFFTKEPCDQGKQDECEFCGTETNTGYRACGRCASNLGMPL